MNRIKVPGENRNPGSVCRKLLNRGAAGRGIWKEILGDEGWITPETGRGQRIET
ncbi:hypothetical protein [Hespellia stercorisuis]|uniref:hypothetical protein n=1 Tax=Hespellia stercorisuis TaxID=180311 RepID=UPI00135652BB|nr:hypothetical protein [Hespellia stercorisuis]